MINITKYAKIFGKKPANFLDNPRIIRLIQPHELKITKGRGGLTLLDERHISEFLLWLHPKVRAAVLNGISTADILKRLDNLDNLKTPET